MNRNLLKMTGIACFGNTWQTDLAARLGVADRTVRRWIKENSTPDLQVELIDILNQRKAEIDEAIDALSDDNDIGLT